MANKTTKKETGLVGLKNLRENMSTYIKRVESGQSLTVVRRNKPIFRITPVDAETENDWETVIDFTDINPNGVSAKKLLAALKSNG